MCEHPTFSIHPFAHILIIWTLILEVLQFFSLPRPHHIKASPAMWYARWPSILFKCSVNLTTRWSILVVNPHSLQVFSLSHYSLIHSSSEPPFNSSSSTYLFIPNAIIRDTSTEILKLFFSWTFTFLLSAFLVHNASAPLQ